MSGKVGTSYQDLLSQEGNAHKVSGRNLLLLFSTLTLLNVSKRQLAFISCVLPSLPLPSS